MAGAGKSTDGGKTPPRKPGATAPRKGAGKRAKPAVKLVEPAAAPEMSVVTPAEPVVSERQVKKVELIDRVVEATGQKRKDVKPVVEAVLGELDRLIGEGADFQAPELGKLMIHKRKDVPNGEMVMLKLRRKTASTPLAKDDDNG